MFWLIWSQSQTPMPSRSLNWSQLRTNSVLNIRSWVGSDRLMQELQERQNTKHRLIALYLVKASCWNPTGGKRRGNLHILSSVCVKYVLTFLHRQLTLSILRRGQGSPRLIERLQSKWRSRVSAHSRHKLDANVHLFSLKATAWLHHSFFPSDEESWITSWKLW